MHEIQMRRRRRLRYDFGKQAEQDTKYSHSHTLSHTHRTRLALVSRVVRTIARRKQSDDTILYLFAATLALPLALSLSGLRGRPSGLWESAAHNQNKTFYNLRAAVFRRCRRVSDGFGF